MNVVRMKDGVPVVSDFAGSEPPLVENYSTGDLYSIDDNDQVHLIGGPGNYLEGDLRLYGGVGDGITDDSAALLAALTIGRNTIIPRGYTFLCSTFAQYTVSSDIHISGGGTLKGTASQFLLKPAGGDILLDDVILDTWLGVVESDAADTGTTDKLVVNNCEFLNIAGLTIDHERPLNSFILQDSRFTDVTGESVRIGKNDFSLQDTWKKITIRNNRWLRVRSSGTASACGAIIYGKEAVIDGNFIEDVDASAGSGEAWGFYTKCRKKSITGNVIIGITGAGSVATVVGINDKGTSRSVVTFPQGYNTIIANNYVEDSGGYGIRTASDESLVANNIIEECGDSAISLDPIGDNFMIIGNKGYVSAAGSTVGIRCGVNGSRLTILNNLMEGFENACLIAVGATEVMTNLLIDGNTFAADAAAGNAIRLSVNASGTLANAVIANNVIASGFKGVQMPSAGTTTGLVVRDNDLRAAGTAINGSIPGGALIKDNLGYDSVDDSLVAADFPNGVYTPTLTNVANLDGSTAFECQYSQSGSTVLVSGKVSVNPTTPATLTQLGISLPVASNIGAQEDCAGVAFASGIAGQGAAIRGDAANNRAEMAWIAGDVTDQPMYFQFQYQVI